MKVMRIMLTISMMSNLLLDACQFYIYNDTTRAIIVYDATLEQSFEILSRRKQLIGDPHKHAHCSIFYKGKPNKAFEFRMVACATPGESTDVLMSALGSGIVPPIFELLYSGVEKVAKTSSSTSGCSACAARHK